MRLNRRDLLRLGAASAVALWARPLAAASGYRVGVGRDTSAYEATMRAVQASGEWAALPLAGRRVIVKPNLVAPRAADTGITTDPEAVRAVVDLALQGGASEVLIVEAGPAGAPFAACGYSGFDSYDASGRVRLVDLEMEPHTLAPLAGGLAYSAISMADLLLDPDAVFISVAKLKTHSDAVATLSMKNLFGLPEVNGYLSTPANGRFAMHDRGVHQTVVDLNRLRRVDFAVVEAIWGLEGFGPIFGTRVPMDVVIAGRNAVAVDRVGLEMMGAPAWRVRHLDYAAAYSLGPMTLDEITVAGDAVAPRQFALPPLPPTVEFPRVLTPAFTPVAGALASAVIWYAQTCLRTVDILRLRDDQPAVDVIKTLRPNAVRSAGFEMVTWNGRGSDGLVVEPGRYAVHVRAFEPGGRGRATDGVGWVQVLAS
jgi:uncharacterized protein (DUF362 family)